MPTACERLAERGCRCLLVVALALGATGLFTVPALAVSPAKWGITMTHANPYGAQAGECPSHKPEPAVPCGIAPFTEAAGEEGAGGEGKTFARESGWNRYTITVTNIGEATSSGTVTVTDQLPAGMMLVGALDSKPAQVSAPGWSCQVLPGLAGANDSAVECTTAKTLAEHQSFNPITLHVTVMPQAANPSTNVATVSGGEAGTASTTPAEGETTVTNPVPFGIAGFTVEDLSSSKAFGQAGGHPVELFTEILTSYTTKESAESTPGEEVLLAPSAGAVKEVQVELPPGLAGDPQNTPQCRVLSSQCPANTAVGYVTVGLGGPVGRVRGGRARIFASAHENELTTIKSLIYNLVPPPGHPAEFGFDYLNNSIPTRLEAKLRSGGNYGVTVGTSAVGEKLLGVHTTFCSYGVTGVNPNFVCGAEPVSPTPASPKPFLRNPTECSSSELAWTLFVTPWDEPENRQEKPAFTHNVTGCEPSKLQFSPELGFEPSAPSEGGTSQADEPTGMTLNLTVPQTNEAGTNGTPDVRNVKMTLPAGMTVSPSAADGLQACTKAQFWPPESGAEPAEHREPAVSAECPRASQIGTVEVFTPLLSGAPAIAGPSTNLTCSQGMWSGGPWSHSAQQLEGGIEELENGNHERLKLAYQWLRNGVAIEHATGTEYATSGLLDTAKALQCQVTAKNNGGSSVAVSRNTELLPAHLPAQPFPPPTIAAPSGTASAGNTLTCAPGAWTSTTALMPTYQWLRGGVEIAGQTGVGYTLTSEDEGKVIQCQVTGTNAGGVAVADSAAVIASPVPSPPPPLPGAALQGQLFQGQPECSPCTNEDAEDGKMLQLLLQVQDPGAGVIIKLRGVTKVNTTTGQLTSEFLNQPQQPFELLHVKLKGGPRAPLANPQTCGPATTGSELTPWSAPGTPVASPESTFQVEGCPPTLPFSPSFNAGTTGANATIAGTYTNFSLTFSRKDREQDLSGVIVHMPPGLTGKIAGIQRCGEAEVQAAIANTGGCPAGSEIGTATSGAGPGTHPFYTEGHVYLTGPYKGAPFGLAVITPAVAGPFNLGNVVVRSAINIDPHTAAVTVTSDPLPQFVDGVQLRLREVNVNVHRPGFMLNPTNCSAQGVSATLTGLQGASAQVASPFGIAGCTSLPFKPTFTASTQANASKTQGASLDVKVTYPPGAYANIAKTLTELPAVLPSRLTTLQKACVDTVFEANPAACPEGSVVGFATAHTPLLSATLSGPAYLVSHGGAAFPDLEIVLQGEGVEVILDGQSDIKKGVTKTTFEALPDSPVSTFELNLPEGPHSVLAANGNLCTSPLQLPTTLTGQNGAVIKQITHIAVIGCPPTVQLAKTKLSGNALLVTVKTSAIGTVKISGKGLKTVTKKNLKPGSHQIRVALTKAGISMHKHHKKLSLRVGLTVGKQTVAKTTSVRL